MSLVVNALDHGLHNVNLPEPRPLATRTFSPVSGASGGNLSQITAGGRSSVTRAFQGTYGLHSNVTPHVQLPLAVMDSSSAGVLGKGSRVIDQKLESEFAHLLIVLRHALPCIRSSFVGLRTRRDRFIFGFPLTRLINCPQFLRP